VVPIESGRQIVASLEELLLGSHDAGLRLDISLHNLVECLRRPLGVERISIELKAQDFALIGLIREGR